VVGRVPGNRLLVLPTALVEPLAEMALAMKQREGASGTCKSAAERMVSPASTPSPPL
jgi:hypothetical protein